MQYLYANAKLSKNTSLLVELNLAATRLHKRLKKLNLETLGISEYNQRYLGSKLNNIKGDLQVCTYLLMWSLTNNTLPLDKFTFVDYGGGSGVLSLLAKELGIGQVIYNDIYDVSCNDARLIAQATNVGINDYVCGDVDQLINYLKKQSFSINAIASYDVIEHIYDIESYLRKLRFLSNSPFNVVFATGGGNIHNPIARWQNRRLQLRCEFTDRKRQWGHKERDSLKGYFTIRKEIIANYEPQLSFQVIEKIAKQTRGLMKQDIEKSVDEYKQVGSISYKPDHPTNTCDPYTGNWAEHLMQSEYLENILQQEEFEVKVLNGYWKYSNKVYGKLLGNIVNLLIKHLGKRGLFLSPYYIVYAKKKI